MRASFFRILATTGKPPEEPSEESKVAFQRILAQILVRSKKNQTNMIALTKQLEGKGYNIRGMLIRKGFYIVNLPNKKVMIGW